MTDVPPSPIAGTQAAAPRKTRSLWAIAIRDTFLRPGARVGLVWIALVALLAIFAPFLASSLPFVVKYADGHIEYPLFASLDATDVLWLAAPVAILLTFLAKPDDLLQRVLAVFWAMSVATPFLYLPVIRAAWPAWRDSSYAGSIVAGIVVVSLIVAVLIGLLSVAISPNRRLMLVVGLPIFVLGLFFLIRPPTPPASVNYTQYRAAQDKGDIVWAVRTIVPFSPNDRLRDVAAKVDQRMVAARPGSPATTGVAPITYAVYGPLPERVDLHPPSTIHWLGTTYYGEDMLSRMLYACRVALTIGVISTGIATAIGVVVGGLMGYYAGWVDLLSMRVIEILESLPRIIILLIITVSFGRNLYLMMTVIGLLGWMGDARFVRAEFLRLRQLDFVQAGKALGLKQTSILFKHMLPNGVSPVLVNASFGVAGAILLESTLSFLGLGLGPEDPSWGQLLEQARQGSAGFNWWIALFPGLSIFLTVFSYILIGEAMRDALDPKLKKRD